MINKVCWLKFCLHMTYSTSFLAVFRIFQPDRNQHYSRQMWVGLKLCASEKLTKAGSLNGNSRGEKSCDTPYLLSLYRIWTLSYSQRPTQYRPLQISIRCAYVYFRKTLCNLNQTDAQKYILSYYRYSTLMVNSCHVLKLFFSLP